MKGIKKLIQNFITALIIVLCFGISVVKSPPALHKAFDYDGNGKTDWSVLRPKENNWYTWRNDAGGLIATPFGISTLDTQAPGDFDGDGKGDIAVWRESDGNFYYLQSSTSTFITKHLGQVGDQPVAKDYDGDGKTDYAVVRRQYSLLYWYILPSSTNVMNGYHFGIYSDHPISGDFDGDGRYDIAV